MLSIVAQWKPCKCGRGARPIRTAETQKRGKADGQHWEAPKARARRAATGGVEEGRMPSAGAARGPARLRIGEGPGCVSGPSVQPGIMPLVPLVPLVRLPPRISYMTKKARAVSGVVEWGNVRLCSLMFAYVRLIGGKMLRPTLDDARVPFFAFDRRAGSPLGCGLLNYATSYVRHFSQASNLALGDHHRGDGG